MTAPMGMTARGRRQAVAVLLVALHSLALVHARTVPEAGPEVQGVGTTRVVLQTLFGEVTVGLFTKEAPVVTEHFLDLVRYGCLDTNHLIWDRAGLVVPGCEEKQLQSNSRQQDLSDDHMPLELSSHKAVKGSLVMVPSEGEGKGESGKTSFRILTEDDPVWDDKTIFGVVLDGWDLISRRARGPDGERMGKKVMIAAAYTVTGGEDDPDPGHDTCSQENVDFYLSDKWTRAVIPLSNECLRQYQREKLRFAGNTAVLLKGLSKMGTTWTEVLTEKLIENVCNEGGLYDCSFIKIGRGAVAAFASDSAEKAAVLRFSAESKHVFPAGKACGADCWEPPSREEIGEFYSAADAPPEWELCVRQRKFWQFHECVPKWAGPPVEEWSDVWMDAADENLTGGESRLRRARDDDPSSEPLDLVKKYVLVMRDPRDTVVSLMHYNTKYSADDPRQLSANVREYFPHYVAWQGFWYYYQLWHVSKHWPTMLLPYRDMLNNPSREYERVLDYLGLKASVDTLQAVVAETSFSSMRRMEQNKELPGRNHANSDRAKVRSGKAGGYLQELDAETVQFCNSVMLDLLPPELNAIFGVQ